ncbi:DOMON-like domain-containing protein [Sphingomonas crocodyli]|uniref:DOMON-like domain-containing protein n=1 Tax=Sphingomonas crocodyli TaxID=1979270 RepID=A0A437MAB1_9SPHN|nr:DOMON-like domain-containing protein [Sphingomonas crocodyli]RVT94572.1 DOMON-like domain-containing protein [Sphingomonas crocodyli]
MLAKRALIAHPACEAPDITVGAKATLMGRDVLKIEYVIIGRIAQLRLPPPGEPARADGLWQHSCFEAFVGLGEGYAEFNFAPSRCWAAYRFDRYREGMAMMLRQPAPDIFVDNEGSRFVQAVFVDCAALSGDWRRIGLSAVIEDVEGRKSYWALAHPPGKPDFHDAACFAIELPAPSLP